MDIKDLDGVYKLNIKTNAGGAYSYRPIAGDICIDNGQVRGIDELSVMWSGYIECNQCGDITYCLTVDPKKESDVVIRKENGLMTEGTRDFIGKFKLAEKNDGAIMLSSFENMSDNPLSDKYTAVVSLQRMSNNTDCGVCKE